MRFAKQLLLPAAILIAGCATNWVPDRWLASPEQSQVQGYGGWATVTFDSNPKRAPIGGELISVAPDQLMILMPSGVIEVSKTGTKRVVVDGYEQDVRPVRRGWLIGSLASITHGYLAPVTVGLWSGAAQAALREAYSYARVTYPGQPWQDLRRYARFPQGLPAGLDVRALQPKPVPPPPPPPPPLAKK
jgi:hypothetical protein